MEAIGPSEGDLHYEGPSGGFSRITVFKIILQLVSAKIIPLFCRFKEFVYCTIKALFTTTSSLKTF
jgi:hypothetical protein